MMLRAIVTKGAHQVIMNLGSSISDETIELNAGTAQGLKIIEATAPKTAPQALTIVKTKKVERKTLNGDAPSKSQRA